MTVLATMAANTATPASGRGLDLDQFQIEMQVFARQRMIAVSGDRLGAHIGDREVDRRTIGAAPR